MSATMLPIGESYFICGGDEAGELNPCSGDVLFPKTWTISMAARWREANIAPGPEWPRIHPGKFSNGERS